MFFSFCRAEIFVTKNKPVEPMISPFLKSCGELNGDEKRGGIEP